jgi:hypothetical protein
VCVGVGILAAFLVLRPPRRTQPQEILDSERVSSELTEPIAQAA